jgi:ParB family chromosome partitioning protein
MDSITYVLTSEICLYATFSNLFPKSLHVLVGLKQHIKANGYDEAFPLILAYGPWTPHDVLLDGHCRRRVCEELGVEKVPVVRRFFETEEEAVAYMIHIQRNRRNLTDAEIVNCIGTLDQLKAVGRPKKLASSEANFGTGKSAERTAAMLGTSRTKVEKVRTILKHGDDEMTRSIHSGKSINKAYEEVQASRKEQEDTNGSTTISEGAEDVSSEMTAVDTVDSTTEPAREEHGDIDTDDAPLNSSVAQIPVLAEASDSPESWPSQVINGFYPASIDYLIVGQGAPPATVNDNEQVFRAPWVVPAESDVIDPPESTPTEEATPTQRSGPANLTNYDAERWYETEKLWAKFIPGFVPDPPPGMEAERTVEDTAVKESPLPQEDVIQVATDANDITLDSEVEVEPKLDARIAQILDLKVRKGGTNVIVQFLAQRGMCRANSFDGIQIDTRRLLAYLLEKDANSLEGFSRLLAEFKASSHIDLPPDEDLQLDLHHSFFDYPYGAQWFWQKCPIKDHNGLLLREGKFGANVLAFMAEHGLNSLEDIVQKVAQMHEELRPRRSAPQTNPSPGSV